MKQRTLYALLITAVLFTSGATTRAFAALTPVEKPAAALPAHPLPALDPNWTKISVRVDVSNLVGPGETGKIPEEDLVSKVGGINEIWSQCALEFVPRTASNISTEKLKIPYGPKSQEDLSKIAEALNPNSSFNGGIPLVVAGPWNFYDAGTGLYLSGLGWVFTGTANRVDRIGAMVDSQKFYRPRGPAIIAHELAHALSLPHIGELKNLMGPGGTDDLTRDQCLQARQFTQEKLRTFLL
jgi:hypothetical protein